ncbi:hypothetical protein P1P75_01010 [Streptomyces sp. ID05-39B]|uniref:DUF7298 domain-containing protein n=1 Tax=Streptomyces sp. ID05-39B TaxID=3028664 RepID=UPI0029A5A561|nr:hypothetical protein [Streptomyces sp. ID05-39B]MDX3525068.1 hypothetical protein [Streptomyces sp. ID05-39B]
MGLLLPGYMPRGVVAVLNLLQADTTAAVTTETMAYQLPFVAAPKRIYRVHLGVYIVDTNTTGDGTATSFPAKNSAVIRARWAQGSSVTITGTPFGASRATVFNDDNSTAGSADSTFYLFNPPAGQVTVGVSIAPVRAAATYGAVSLSPSTGSHLVIEDVGPYAE